MSGSDAFFANHLAGHLPEWTRGIVPWYVQCHRVLWVMNEPITTLQQERQVIPLSNHCTHCPPSLFQLFRRWWHFLFHSLSGNHWCVFRTGIGTIFSAQTFRSCHKGMKLTMMTNALNLLWNDPFLKENGNKEKEMKREMKKAFLLQSLKDSLK